MLCVCVCGGGGGSVEKRCVEKLKVQGDDKYLSLASFPLFSLDSSLFSSLYSPLPPLSLFSSLGVFHCVFGDLQESLVSACREALDTAAQDKDRTIVFWMNGFAAVSSEWRVIVLEMITTYDHYI